MSMHLAGHAFTTNSTCKRKSNIVVNEKFMDEYRDYNKQMKRVGSKLKTLDEYIQYRQGKKEYKPRVVKSPLEATSYRRPSPVVPSGIGIGVSNTKRDEKVYTGDRLMGIATMHKSNMVPVFKREDAEDIAKMRR